MRRENKWNDIGIWEIFMDSLKLLSYPMFLSGYEVSEGIENVFRAICFWEGRKCIGVVVECYF